MIKNFFLTHRDQSLSFLKVFKCLVGLRVGVSVGVASGVVRC